MILLALVLGKVSSIIVVPGLTMIITLIFNPLAFFVGSDSPGSYIVLLPLTVIYLFILGAIVGWFYGKIKNNKLTTKN